MRLILLIMFLTTTACGKEITEQSSTKDNWYKYRCRVKTGRNSAKKYLTKDILFYDTHTELVTSEGRVFIRDVHLYCVEDK